MNSSNRQQCKLQYGLGLSAMPRLRHTGTMNSGSVTRSTVYDCGECLAPAVGIGKCWAKAS